MKKEDKPYTNGFDPEGFEIFAEKEDKIIHDNFIKELLKAQIREIYKGLEEDDEDE